MEERKTICIFCSSSDYLPKIYFDSAEEIGRLFAKENFDLIYGGGNLGLMGMVARSFKDEKAKITGVIPRKLHLKVGSFDKTDEIIVTESMSQRKMEMFTKAYGFIVLPGGFGTLDEAMEVITLKQLGYLNKPIAFLNVNKFYDNLFKQFEVIYQEKFAYESNRNLYFISETSEKIVTYMRNYYNQTN
ncbi:MAG: Rossman fold protein, TIGR00730 family [Spirochaetes bacterium GWD1_27_9]|nr:MAG: Rossman fold protein, TIGR00730 family [Spirochaetes bacterium GWB1_27_13]OHD21953.1 MAG: Rossman fold protein, TIGR00730 family [Spirochaetes bacterium GWC1_27_15]OHD35310.1 MAG: Rossman fold protein, TIGR00730 family [Spirochaetes bacterium GWD1_27_9]